MAFAINLIGKQEEEVQSPKEEQQQKKEWFAINPKKEITEIYGKHFYLGGGLLYIDQVHANTSPLPVIRRRSCT